MYKKMTVQISGTDRKDTFVLKDTKIPSYKRKKGDAVQVLCAADLPNMQAQMVEQLYYIVDYINLEDCTGMMDVYENFEYVANMVVSTVKPNIIRVCKYVGNPQLHRLFINGDRVNGKAGMFLDIVNITDILGYKFSVDNKTIKNLELRSKFEVLAELGQFAESFGDYETQCRIECILEAYNRCFLCGAEQIYDEVYYKAAGIWKCSGKCA